MKFYLVVGNGRDLYNWTSLMTLLFSCCLAANIRRSRNADNVCATKECTEIADILKRIISATINPCDNFYDYVCEGWIKSNPVPNGLNAWHTFSTIKEKNNLLAKQLFEKTSLKSPSKSEQKALWYYRSCKTCLNRPLDKVGDEPLKEMIADLGGWNMVNTMNIKKWSLQYSLKTTHAKYGISVLVGWMLGFGSPHLVLQTPELFLPLILYSEAFRKIPYIEFMVIQLSKIGVLLGLPKGKVTAELKDTFEFERELAKIYEETENDNVTVATLSQVMKEVPSIDWLDFFHAEFTNSKVNISRDTKVKYKIQMLKKIQLFLKEALSTSIGKIRLQNYFVWRSLYHYISTTSKAFKIVNDQINSILSDKKGENCLDQATKGFGNAAGAMYVNATFDPESKKIAVDMVKKIRWAFDENLKTLKWIDEDSKKVATVKEDLMHIVIGYPELLENATELDNEYRNLSIHKYDFFGNKLRLDLFKKENRLRDPFKISKMGWLGGIMDANAFYAPSFNHMEVPAGILQLPLFHRTYPLSLNFGATGFIIGHELTHGFDANGRLYDAHGKLKNTWNKEAINNFDNLTRCFVDQYSNYSVLVNNSAVNVNGTFTLNENIADNGGIKLSYLAYLKAVEGKPDMVLPGLQYTGPQLFFISFAHTFCGNFTSEAVQFRIKNDKHAPHKVRINAVLRNFPQFSEAFKCSPGSYMNPAEKCKIW